MQLFMVLDPGVSPQLLLVETVAPGGTLEGVHASIAHVSDEDTLFVAVAQASESLGPCTDRYGRLAGWDFRCLEFDLPAEPGAAYALRVEAPGRPTATAKVIVPGPVEILDAQLAGVPPGTGGLTAAWSESATASGYFVSVRPALEPECVRTSTCPDGWFAATTATQIETSVPEQRLPDHPGQWLLEIRAVDEVLFDHLTTGAGGTLFPVRPVQNVEGGFGAVGAWVKASYPVPEPPSGLP